MICYFFTSFLNCALIVRMPTDHINITRLLLKHIINSYKIMFCGNLMSWYLSYQSFFFFFLFPSLIWKSSKHLQPGIDKIWNNFFFKDILFLVSGLQKYNGKHFFFSLTTNFPFVENGLEKRYLFFAMHYRLQYWDSLKTSCGEPCGQH